MDTNAPPAETPPSQEPIAGRTRSRTRDMAQVMRERRAKESAEEREARQQADRERNRSRRERQRAAETDDERAIRLQDHRLVERRRLEEEDIEETRRRRADMADRMRTLRHSRHSDIPLEHNLGPMSVSCSHCGAFFFRDEAKGGEDHINVCCNFGNIIVEDKFHDFPAYLRKLLTENSLEGRNFRLSIRQFNSALAMASMGAQLDVPRGHGPYCFRIHGQVYHFSGPLHPAPGQKPSFGQIYIMDTFQAAQERMNNRANYSCDPSIMHHLSALLARINTFAQSFKMMSEVEEREEATAAAEGRAAGPVKMVFDLNAAKDPRRYNAATANEVAVVYVGEDDDIPATRALAVHPRSGGLKAIYDIDPIVDPLTYPIFFPTGALGWHPELRRREDSARKRTRITQKEYYSFLLQARRSFNPLLHGGALLQQFIVDCWVKIEQNRLNFHRTHQAELRSEQYRVLRDFVEGDADTDGPPGKRIILPSSFPGSPRAMKQDFQDAMAIVSKYGKPDFFLTMTCNPKWKEITSNLLPHQTATDRPDIVARVFKLKVDALFEELLHQHVLGEVLAYVSVFEWQKRGLPHIHCLLIMKEHSKPRSPEDVNRLVCAELPDPEEDPELYAIVSSVMIHRPCGDMDPSAPCMVDGQCSKRFRKDFRDETNIQVDGYPEYRRRNDGRTVESGGHVLDNRWVVPYNPYILLCFNAHINVEICAMIEAVKYLFKYVYKGHDRASLHLSRVGVQGNQDGRVVDEISAHLDARYVCAPEAMHHMLGFPVEKKSDTVYRLAFHLPDFQDVYFRGGEETNAVNRAAARDTTLLAWFKLNQCSKQTVESGNIPHGFSDSRLLRYIDMPSHFTYDQKSCTWKTRQRGGRLIGRMYTVSPKEPERFALRALLLNVKGALSFEDLRTVPDESGAATTHSTFVEAAKARGLLNDDRHFLQTLQEAACFQMPSELRGVFVAVFAFNEITDLFYLDGPGGSGKTYLYNALFNSFVGRGLKVLCTAWTGIAANLLPGGRTAASVFKLNIKNDCRDSSHKRQKKEAQELGEVDVIIWDEASMIPKTALETADEVLRDITQDQRPFGGKVVILGGDFRQVLPVVRKGSRQEQIDQCIKSSVTLWPQFRSLTLRTNMRVTSGDAEWIDFLLKVGDGSANEEDRCITLPDSIQRCTTPNELCTKVFGDVVGSSSTTLCDAAILAPKNVDVDFLNDIIHERMDGTEKIYESVDEAESDDPLDTLQYPMEFLNQLRPSRMPPHRLRLKKGSVVMLLRNLDVTAGLCNGARLIVEHFGRFILGCRFACGDRKGKYVLIPRIHNYADENLPFRLKRTQFPLKLSYALSINKSQGQSFDRIGLFLPCDVFTHGQLYVALSRVRTKERLHILCGTPKLKNIVYNEVL